MARTTATKSSRLRQQPQAEIDSAIRKLVKAALELQLKSSNYKKADFTNQQKAEIVSNVTNFFGDALFTMVDCATVQEIELTIADEGEDDEDQDSDGSGYDDI
jgi:hypothetical protein